MWLLAHSAGTQSAVLAAHQKKVKLNGLILIEPAGPPDNTDFPSLNGLHMFGVYGDYIVSRNQTSRKVATEDAAVLFKNAGGIADVVSLPDDSLVKGNSHIMMQDKNNQYVFGIIRHWLCQFGSISSSFSKSICAGSSFMWNGISRTTAGSYKDTFKSLDGCDSIVTCNLSINPIPTPSSFNKSICAGTSVNWGGLPRNTTGSYTAKFSGANGCDSMITMNLSITPAPDKTATVSGTTITAVQSGANYQWYDCTTKMPISGAISKSYTPTMTGLYKVALNLSGCSDTSNCVPITIGNASINLVESQYEIIIYPNPSNGNFEIHSTVNGIFILSDIYGRPIREFEISIMENKLRVNSLAQGIYFLSAKSTNHNFKPLKVEVVQ